MPPKKANNGKSETDSSVTNSKQTLPKVDSEAVEATLKATPDRNLDGSLEQCRTSLREAYINFKDQSKKCVIDIENYNRGSEGKVFYFQPDTFLLNDPEKEQKVYRENLLKRISQMPRPESISMLGDDLHRQMSLTLADQSQPRESKRSLNQYFKRRQYTLQHRKYKLLTRWAHHALTAESMERMSSEATFLFSKLEYSTEQAMSRQDRLNQEDFYDEAIKEVRPSTCVNLGEELGFQTLYVEKKDLKSQSLIREDDIEVYIRGVSYKNKVSKTVNKFMTRLKWIPLEQRYEIFEKAMRSNKAIKQKNIKKQEDLVDRIKQNIGEQHIDSADLQEETKNLLNSLFITRYKAMYRNNEEALINSWRANHQECPNLINNLHELKLRTLDLAQSFHIKSDIELDHGYGFKHQIDQQFNLYFQRQVIKSQFSLYDAFVGQDANEKQKGALMNMAKIDTNIFRDISTEPDTVPTNDSILEDLKDSDIKILRLKSAYSWICYVALVPGKPDWLKKQMAILGNVVSNDSLLVSAMNYLDVNDLATVNSINEDTANEHRKAVERQNDPLNPHNQFKSKQVSAQEGEQTIALNLMEKKSAYNTAYNMEQHLLKTVQGSSSNHHPGGAPQTKKKKASSGILSFVPQHLIVSYNSLRYMRSRDAKTKVMYCLNFFRAIQKRLALDLREFGTRDRVDSHLVNPFIFSEEANKQVEMNATWAPNMYDGGGGGIDDFEEEKAENVRKTMVFDNETLDKMRNLPSVKMYKVCGQFNNKVFSTAPFFPKFHCTFGEPTVEESESQQADNERKNKGLSKSSGRFMGRIDHIEINEKTEEVFVKDDFGIYIMYDCVLQDMKMAEDEMCRLGSYFITKQEVLQDPTVESSQKPQPQKDRLEILHDVLLAEASFQYRKVRLVQCYMECYEHVCDPLEQQRLMQVITDLMARRPRIDLQAGYFVDAYEAESECLDAQFKLMRLILQKQVSIEKAENKRLQDALNLSYVLSAQYEKNKYKYQDTEALLHQLIKFRKQQKTAQTEMETDKNQEGLFSHNEESLDSVKDKKASKAMGIDADVLVPGASAQETAQGSHVEGNPANDTHNDLDDFDIEDYFQPEENEFIKLLGLPEITIESLFAQYKDKDKEIGKIMNEHANFTQVYEGYPEFIHFTAQNQGTHGRRSNSFRISPWSEDVGNLDFYESLDFATKLNGILIGGQQELQDTLKPHNMVMTTHIDTQYALAALDEFRRVLRIQEGGEDEYQGREFVEDEAIVGSSEKMIFYLKEMVAQLTNTPKYLQDPFVIAKLDINTVRNFEFPPLNKDMNKFVMRGYNIPGGATIVKNEKDALVGMAKASLGAQKATMNDIVNQTRQNMTNNSRNIDVPMLLELYCNMMELQRLRSELIMTASDTAVLQNIYIKQMALCKKSHIKATTEESISFAEYGDPGDGPAKINYLDDGPGHQCEIGLTIKEFDPALLSNLNYKHPDAFKMSVLTSGLEEVRAVLAYQLMQKQLLVVATRSTQLMIDTHQKAICEMNLLEKEKISVPNPYENVKDFFTTSNHDVIQQPKLAKKRKDYESNMSNCVGNVLYNVLAKKSQMRTTISKLYSDYQTAVSSKFPESPETVLRVMRCYKIKLLHRQLQSILLELYLDAQKVQALQTCQRLRHFSRFFHFDMNKLQGGSGGQTKKGEQEEDKPQIFVNETNNMFENIPYAYKPEEIQEMSDKEKEMMDKINQKGDVNVLNVSQCRILEHNGIPSSAKLMECDACHIDDIRKMKGKVAEIVEEKLCKRLEAKSAYLWPKYSTMSGIKDPDAAIAKYCEAIRKYGRQSQADIFNEVLTVEADAPGHNEPEFHLKTLLPHFTPVDLEAPTPSLSSKDKEKAKVRAKRVNKITGLNTGLQSIDYEECYYFADTRYAKLISYYQNLERILTLEWFITKLQFKHDEVVFFDQAMEMGLPFWYETKYEEFLKAETGNVTKLENTNQSIRVPNGQPDEVRSFGITQDFLYSEIVKHQTKENFATELMTTSGIVKNIIKKFCKTKPEYQGEYMAAYVEYRYMQITGSLQKLIEQFYRKNNLKAVQCVKEALALISKTDHVKLSFNRTNSYHVNNSLVSPHTIPLDPCNILTGFYNNDEATNFTRCVQPVVNEKALEPPQVTLFQSLYQTDPMRKQTLSQFSGQFISTHNSTPFSSLETALLDMGQNERTHCQLFFASMKYQANDYMETVCQETGLSEMATDAVYDFQQLEKARKYIADNTTALLLKNAVIMWCENSQLPDDTVLYERFERNFRDNYFWKCVEEKEVMKKTVRSEIPNMPTEEELGAIQKRITDITDNHSTVQESDQVKMQKLVKELREEFQTMKKKVTLDNYFAVLAEKRVLANEIEKEIIRASVRTLDDETTALERCFTMSVGKIQMVIHPFQQFAACLYDRVDRNSHLDVVTKVDYVQNLLTKLRNRGTEVDTLTSGTGMVFTIKDLNECLNDFCRDIVKYSEKQMKSRSELLFQKSEHYEQLLYVKDQKIADMERRLKNQNKNLDNLISARLFEKGNQMIYELDNCNRLIPLFKRNLMFLEQKVHEAIVISQKNKFDRMSLFNEENSRLFKTYRENVKFMIKTDFAADHKKAAEKIEKKKNIAIVENKNPRYKVPTFYPITGDNAGPPKNTHDASGHKLNKLQAIKGTGKASDGSMTGAVVPEGWVHYPFCDCYAEKEGQPKPTLKMAKAEMLSEQEAFEENMKMAEYMRKQRIFFRTKEMLIHQKYQDKIKLMKKQMQNNSYMHDKMNQLETTNQVFKQNLKFTQQSLASAEKVIEKLNEEIKKIESDRQRLSKYKVSKAERLRELEDKIKNYEVYENVDTEKLVQVLVKQDNEVKDLRSVAKNCENRIFHTENKAQNEMKVLQSKFQKEQTKQHQVVEKMEQMKMELKMLETNDSSVASIWKKKCVELFEVCSVLKEENTEVRTLCNELILQGMHLTDAINTAKDDSMVQGSVRGSQFSPADEAARYSKFDETSYQVDSPDYVGKKDWAAKNNSVALPSVTGSQKKTFNYRGSRDKQQNIQELLHAHKRNILTAQNNNYAGGLGNSFDNQNADGTEFTQPGDLNKMARTGFTMNAPGTTHTGQRGRQQNGGSGQKMHSLMNQTLGPRGTQAPSGTGSGLGKSSIFSNPTPAPVVGRQRPHTKAPVGKGSNDIRSVLNSSGHPQQTIDSMQMSVQGNMQPTQAASSQQRSSHDNGYSQRQASLLASQNRAKQQEFREQMGAATAHSRDVKNVSNNAKLTQVTPGVIASTGQVRKDSLYESSKNSTSAYQVRVNSQSGLAKKQVSQAKGLRMNQPSEIMKNGIVAVERNVANIHSEGTFDAQPQTEGLAGSSEKCMPEFNVATKGTLPSVHPMESQDSQTGKGETEKVEEGGVSLPSTREIKSREKMADQAE